MKKNYIIGAAAFLVIAGAALWWFMGANKNGTENLSVTGNNAAGTEGSAATAESFGGDVYQKTGGVAPVEKMPETNPFEKTANPYTDAYKNPF